MTRYAFPRTAALLAAATLILTLVPYRPAAAAVSFVGASSSGSGSARNSIALPVPTGTAAGDVMVASIVSNDDDPAFGAPPGWALVRDDSLHNALRQAVYVRVASSSEPASYTWTLSDWRRLAGGIVTFAGIDPDTPVDAHGATLDASPGTTVVAPSITTSMADTRLVHLAAVKAEGTVTPPPGMTERWEAASPKAKDDRDTLAAASDAAQSASGPTGERVATASLPGPRIGVLLALRPAGGTPPPPDTTPPDTVITAGPSGTVDSRTADFSFTADEPGSTFECRLDGDPFTGCSSPHGYTNLANGSHEFAVRAVDPAGNLDPTPATATWIVDVTDPPPATGVINLVAGTGVAGYSGDGGPATQATLSEPRTIAVDTAGNIFVADTYNHAIRRISPDGIITTVAGTGVAGFSGDGGPATSARMKWPHSVALDQADNLYIADSPNHRIRRVDAQTGIITTVAGSGAKGFSGDGGAATSARLNHPKGVEIGTDGLIYIADSLNHRIRRVDGEGIIQTVAGNGAAGSSGDGGPATSARLNRPRNIVFSGGILFIADDSNHRVRRVDSSGTITTYAGNGVEGYGGDGGVATEASFNNVRDIALDHAGNLYVADEGNHRIRHISPTGIVTTYAGTGIKGYGGDGGPATAANLKAARGVAVDGHGGVVVADTFNHRIRRVT